VLVPQPSADSWDPGDLSTGVLTQPDTAQPDGDRRRAFCAALRAARERHGIPLSTIAAATKISVSHLAALERNDLSRWPAGIYRKAWIRSYASAIGLPVEATVEAFIVAFDPAPLPPEAPAAESSVEAPLRLTLAPMTRMPWSSINPRKHAIDIAIAVALAILIAWVTESGFWAAAGVLALCAYAPLVGIIKRATTRISRT
jgi:transcriptional regulator with XRE-family HTH domain